MSVSCQRNNVFDVWSAVRDQLSGYQRSWRWYHYILPCQPSCQHKYSQTSLQHDIYQQHLEHKNWPIKCSMASTSNIWNIQTDQSNAAWHLPATSETYKLSNQMQHDIYQQQLKHKNWSIKCSMTSTSNIWNLKTDQSNAAWHLLATSKTSKLVNQIQHDIYQQDLKHKKLTNQMQHDIY